MQSYIRFKDPAIVLRRNGRTYEDARIIRHGKERIRDGNLKAIAAKKLKRRERDEELFRRNIHLKDILDDKDVAKLGLAMLYLCEGSKHQSSGLCFGNSNAGIIQLFLRLLRSCYLLDERKFRATVQCRADQNGKELTSYWSAITQVTPNQFYRHRIDKRTIGAPTKKLDYKGVCRIEYFSTAIYNELRIIGGFL